MSQQVSVTKAKKTPRGVVAMRNWWILARLGTAVTAFVYFSFMGRFIDIPFTESRTKSPLLQNEAKWVDGDDPNHLEGQDNGRIALSRTLEDFAKNLAPSAKMKKRVRNTIIKLQSTIHKHMGKKYSIDRIVPLGSYSKKTSIWFNMDLDITVYIDDQFPPFKGILGDIEEAVKAGLDTNCIRKNHLVKAKLNGLDVDIIPATNFVKPPLSIYENKAFTQVRNALQFLRGRQVDYADFSTALTSGAVEFEKKRSSYSRTMSRLAKFWSTLVGVQDFHYGRSSLMEYLGVYAAELESSHDVLRGFRRFLQLITHSDTLDVVWTMFYSREDIPVHILKQHPIVLDPTNPRNNFLHDRTHAHIKTMSSYARATLKRLDDAERNTTSRVLLTIFEPQPKLRELFRPKYKIPCNFLVGTIHTSENLPRVKTRHRVSGAVKPRILEDYLFAFADVAAASIQAELDETDRNAGCRQWPCELTRRVVEELRARVLGSRPGNWSLTSGHDDRQMTFFVPVVQDSNEYIVVSCDWVG